jgi:large subunit ribosomal protein L20
MDKIILMRANVGKQSEIRDVTKLFHWQVAKPLFGQCHIINLMPRIKRGKVHLRKRRALLKRVKGFGAGRKKLIKLAKTADTRAGMHAYRDRRVKKRNMRGLFQIRINAGAREHGLSYSKFIGLLKENQIGLNRKMLSEIAADVPAVFEKIVTTVKK